MIIPAIGEAPDWLITYAVLAAVIAAYIIRRFLKVRTRKVETLIDLIMIDIRNIFIKISRFVRSIQIDTINADTSLMAFGIILILIIYMLVMLL
jgi:hypothetical protein